MLQIMLNTDIGVIGSQWFTDVPAGTTVREFLNEKMRNQSLASVTVSVNGKRLTEDQLDTQLENMNRVTVGPGKIAGGVR